MINGPLMGIKMVEDIRRSAVVNSFKSQTGHVDMESKQLGAGSAQLGEPRPKYSLNVPQRVPFPSRGAKAGRFIHINPGWKRPSTAPFCEMPRHQTTGAASPN